MRSKRTLPVVSLLRRGFLAPLINFRSIFKACYPAFFLLVLATILEESSSSVMNNSRVEVGMMVLSVALYSFAMASVVGCHRIFILGPHSIEGRRIVWFGSSIWRYFGWSLGIGILVSLTVIPGALLLGPELFEETTSVRSMLAGAVVFLPAAYVGARLSLLLPAAAIDYMPELQIEWGWDLSKTSEWQLFFLVGLIPLATDTILDSLFTSDYIVVDIFVRIVWVYVAIAELAILSFSFDFITQQEVGENEGNAN